MYFGETSHFCKREEGEEEEEEEEEEKKRSELMSALGVTVEALLTHLLPYLSKPKWLHQEKWGGIVQDKTGDCSVYSSTGYRIGSF